MFPELNAMNGTLKFDEFLAGLEQYQILNAGRFAPGESLYNFLHMVRPELAKSVVQTEYDPFYRDENIDRCLNFLRQTW